MDPTLVCALWGVGGAFMYAGQQLSACAFSRKPGEPLAHCIFNFCLALIVGGIAAAAFSQPAQHYLKQEGAGILRGLSALIGLVANPLAPRLITRLSNWLLKKAPGS